MVKSEMEQLSELVIAALEDEVCGGWEYDPYDQVVTLYRQSMQVPPLGDDDYYTRASVGIRLRLNRTVEDEYSARVTLNIAGRPVDLPLITGSSFVSVARQACERVNRQIDAATKEAHKVKFALGD